MDCRTVISLLLNAVFLLASLFMTMVPLSGQQSSDVSEDALNIIWIMADDLGYGDLAPYVPHYTKDEQRETLANTPNIDRLAENGTLFTNVYAGHPMCAPSRATLLTGRHTGQNNCRDIWDPGGDRIGLKPGTPTFANVLKKAGYHTSYFGKWHAIKQARKSMQYDHNKLFPHFGWNEWYASANRTKKFKGTNHWPSHVIDNNKVKQVDNKFDPNKTTSGRPLITKKGAYFDDLITEHTCNFLRQNHEKPFVAYVNFTAPHTLFTAPDRKKIAKKHGWDEQTAGYVWMLEKLDEHVGAILDQLEQQGLREDTVVFFTSDNGGINYGAEAGPGYGQLAAEQPINGGLRRGKGTLYEGGLRVPMIVSLPGTIPEDNVSDQPWYFPDALPTFVDIAGADDSLLPDALTGRSVWPVLRGELDALDPRPMYWNTHRHYGFRQAVRLGNWKLIRFSSLNREHPIPAPDAQPETSPPAYLELYNMNTDPGERKNIAKEHPDVVRKLTGIMNDEYESHPEYPLSDHEKKLFKIRNWEDISGVYSD